MKQKTNSLSKLLYIISAILMLSILFLSVESATAWFTSGSGLKIECVIHIGKLNMSIYQVSPSAQETLIKSYDDNTTSDTPSYIDLNDGNSSRELLPDTAYSLKLLLKNEDIGSEAMYLRYKIELFACSATDLLIDYDMSGYLAPVGTDNGFGHDSGYYYYQNNSGVLQKFMSGASAYIIGTFSIPYSSFESISGGANVKIVITVECSDTIVF